MWCESPSKTPIFSVDVTKWWPMFQNTEPVKNPAERSTLPWHSSPLFKLKCTFAGIFGLQLLQFFRIPCTQGPNKILQIPRNFAHQGPHIAEIPGNLGRTENQECCRLQGFMHSMTQKSRLLCAELPGLQRFGHWKSEKIAWNCRKYRNSIPQCWGIQGRVHAKDQANIDTWNRKRTHSKTRAEGSKKRVVGTWARQPSRMCTSPLFSGTFLTAYRNSFTVPSRVCSSPLFFETFYGAL